MKVETTRRYNSKKKASYEVRVWLTDWECSMTISALKHYTKTYQLPKGTKGFVEKHLKAGFSKALGTVLKAEFNDINKNNNRKTNEYIKNAKQIIDDTDLTKIISVKEMVDYLKGLDELARDQITI